MNKLAIGIVSILLITGCSNTGKWITRDFDNVEFGKLAELHVLALN